MNRVAFSLAISSTLLFKMRCTRTKRGSAMDRAKDIEMPSFLGPRAGLLAGGSSLAVLQGNGQNMTGRKEGRSPTFWHHLLLEEVLVLAVGLFAQPRTVLAAQAWAWPRQQLVWPSQGRAPARSPPHSLQSLLRRTPRQWQERALLRRGVCWEQQHSAWALAQLCS